QGDRAQIGAPGFEPGTSCSQSTRATRLRHAPSGGEYRRRKGSDGYGSGRNLGQARVDDLGDAGVEGVEDRGWWEDDVGRAAGVRPGREPFGGHDRGVGDLGERLA